MIWLASVSGTPPAQQVYAEIAEMKQYLQPQGLAEDFAVVFKSEADQHISLKECLDIEEAAQADLLINLAYLPHNVVKRFRRSAFVDIDPGLTQTWMSLDQLEVAKHETYFTFGETVGQPLSSIPDCGLKWCYTPPPVFLPAWPMKQPGPGAPYTTISNWWGSWIDISGTLMDNSKRTAFLDYLDLPLRVPVRLELALPLTHEDIDIKERRSLERHGWAVRRTDDISSTPEAFRTYLQHSRGEFSCMKPGYILLKTAWTSERTLNYLASGKPAIIQHTGPSRFLPDAEGLFRFRDLEEAVRYLSIVEKDYERHSRAALALAEEYFDARKVLTKVLERAL